MALFGDLADHAFADLAKILKSQTGILFLHQAYQNRTLELNLTQGQLRSLYLDGFPIVDQARIREIFQHLQSHGQGTFEFQQRTPSSTVPSFHDLAFMDLLQAPLETFVPLQQLPHPDTRFTLSGTALAVPAALAENWALFQPHLVPGASCAELSARLGRAEHDVRVMMHRLRTLDLVTPQRAGLQATSPRSEDASFTPREQPAAPPLVHRFLNALRRLTGTAKA